MMEYLHLFSTNLIRTNYEQGNDYIEPYVSLVTEDDSVHYNVPYTPKFGDYLLSDLKTIVKQSEITEQLKPDAVGICIGQNPVSGKNVFWNVNSMTDTTTYKFYVPKKFDASKFTTKSEGEAVAQSGGPNFGVNRDIFGGESGYIMATVDISKESPQNSDYLLHFGEFGGLLNTIEWYKQATAAGIDIPTDMPALNALMQLSNVQSLDDNYNSWFLGGMGHIALLCGENMLWGPLKTDESFANYTTISEAVSKLGKTYMNGLFWGSSFCSQGSGDSLVHSLSFVSGYQGWNGSSADGGYRLFALIER